MNIAKQALISAVLGLLFFATSTLAQDDPKLLGMWKLVAFHTEDVQTKARNNVYGEQPIGYMRVWDDGRFDAYAVQDRPEPVQSIWEDVAQIFSEQAATYRAIFYSGKYRVDGDKLIVHIDRVLHEGWVGVQAFDMSWNEARTATAEVRYFYLASGPNDRDVLRIETPPTANPNGAGNTIIGRVVWERSSESE